jgi:lipopolysaccharide biosynthesis glycosyltransferase
VLWDDSDGGRKEKTVKTVALPKMLYLACAADDFYAMPLGVTVYSALANLSRDCQITLFVLDGGIRKPNKLKLTASLDPARVTIHWLHPSVEQIQRVYHESVSPYPVSAYLRLLLPDLIPHDVTKIIYLDTDVVVAGNLETLWDIELGDRALLAVQDPVHRFIAYADHLQHLDRQALGIQPDQKYLNSGVLVINLEKWRSARIAEQIVQFLAQHPELPYPDQDGISVVLAGQWQELAPEWNQVHVLHLFASWQQSPYSQQQFLNALDRPSIIHFTSRPKPWMPSRLHPQRQLFLQYLNRTAWSGWTEDKWNHAEQLVRRSVRRVLRQMKRVGVS